MLHRLIVVAGAALGLLATAPASAQSAPQSSTARPYVAAGDSHQALAVELMNAIFSDVLLNRMIEVTQTQLGQEFADEALPADWTPVILEAAAEMVHDKRPAMINLMARELGKRFTDAELRAGVSFMNTHGGQAIVQAGALGKPMPRLSRADERELDAIYNTPAGKGFLEKIGKLDEHVFDGAKTDSIRALTPAFLRRMGEKLEAFEAQRTSTLGPPTEHQKRTYQLVEAMFNAYGYDQMLADMTEGYKQALGANLPADWLPAITEGASESVLRNRDRFVWAYAMAIESRFNDEELEMGAALFTSDVGRQMMRARARNEPDPVLTRQQTRDVERIYRMRGATGFVAKAEGLALEGEDLRGAVRLLLPDMIKSMGMKIEAYEAQRPLQAD